MNTVLRHIAMPAIAPAVIVALYLAPVQVFGCVYRGLLALAVVLISAVAALITTVMAMRTRATDCASANWWILSALILLLPIALVLGPLG